MSCIRHNHIAKAAKVNCGNGQVPGYSEAKCGKSISAGAHGKDKFLADEAMVP